MIKITTDKKIKEEVMRELDKERSLIWQNERIEKLETRMRKLEDRVNNLTQEIAVDKTAVRPTR